LVNEQSQENINIFNTNNSIPEISLDYDKQVYYDEEDDA
jgi:hypothetical protein